MLLKGSLLLVDADENLRNNLSGFLADQGYACSVAGDGEEALIHLGAHAPDAIILDRALRRMSGDELARQIRANPTWAHIPILVLTATDPADNAMIGFDVDPEDYIRKPFSVRVLLDRIESNLAGLAVA